MFCCFGQSTSSFNWPKYDLAPCLVSLQYELIQNQILQKRPRTSRTAVEFDCLDEDVFKDQYRFTKTEIELMASKLGLNDFIKLEWSANRF